MNARQSLVSTGVIENRSRAAGLTKSRVVRLEAILAAGLILTAILWNWVRDLGLGAHLEGGINEVLIGVSCTIVLCLSLPFVTSEWSSRVLLLREMKGVWDGLLTPLGKSLTLYEIAILAVLSGVSEELFFRGILQPEIGIVAASICFGLLHPVNLSYVLWATVVGFGFGLLFETTGSLIPSMICHGGYNFVALVYLRYWYLEEDRNHVLLAP